MPLSTPDMVCHQLCANTETKKISDSLLLVRQMERQVTKKLLARDYRISMALKISAQA